MVANGQLDVLLGTVLLDFDVANFMFRGKFIIIEYLPNPRNGLRFLRRYNAIFEVTQGILTFTYLSMQFKPDIQVTLRQATPLFAGSTYMLHPGETLAIASRIPHMLDLDAIGTVPPSPQFEHHYSISITS